MNDIMLPVIIGVVAIIVGYGIAKILEKNKASHIIKSAKKRARNGRKMVIYQLLFFKSSPNMHGASGNILGHNL